MGAPETPSPQGAVADAGLDSVDGRELPPAVVILSGVVGGISLTVGALLAVTSLAGYAAAAWVSQEPLSPGPSVPPWPG
ncbi:hypothetical protein [Streptomyces narbonensis]|uniref:hypothetical protein n=1 Tax=Streptomyces narbonensis TaxID=67333 RepID=UPI0033EABA93